jgi:hypothetical protein
MSSHSSSSCRSLACSPAITSCFLPPVTPVPPTAPQFLGALSKLQKAINSFVMSLHLSVRMKKSAPCGWILIKIDISVFSKNCREN